MPEELKPPYTGGGISTHVLLWKPEFGPHIATVSHIWAMIEMNLADLMMWMERLGSLASVNEYLSIYRFDLRVSKISAAAKNVLPQYLQDKLPEMFKKLTVCHSERNRLAHARWAENWAFPDGIIMLPHAEEFFAGKKSIWLYKIKDFVEIERRLVAAEGETHALSYSVYELLAERERQSLSQTQPPQ